MRRYIIIPCVLSIIGHGLFFSIFKVDARSASAYQNTLIYLVTEEQLDYIRSKDVIVSPLSKSLFNKNPLWKDILDIVEVKSDTAVTEDIELLEDFKSYNFQEIQIPLGGYKDLNRDIIPMYSNLFYPELLQERISQGGELILDLKSNIKMGYYLQGPISLRRLTIEGVPDVDKTGIRAGFRFWVTKDGRVNQVIVEEGSTFPLVDSELVNFIKTWRFNPIFDLAAHNYEWGIVRVRLLK